MIIQQLKSFNGVGGAVRAQIEKHADRGVHRIVTLDAKNKVVELADFPIAWGIWTCREFLMSSDMKASGRTTRTYDATPA